MSAEVVVDLFVSIDGWAGGDGLPGFFGYDGPELAAWIAREKSVPETVIMGRRTYETFESLPPQAWEDDRSHLMSVEKVIYSRTLDRVDWPRTRISADLVGDVRAAKDSQDARLRTWGSMSLARQLLVAGLVDRLRLMRFPLLAGESGREAAFADVASSELELLGHSVLDGRILLEEYRPTGRDIPRM